MKPYESPSLEVVSFENDEILTGSRGCKCLAMFWADNMDEHTAGCNMDMYDSEEGMFTDAEELYD